MGRTVASQQEVRGSIPCLGSSTSSQGHFSLLFAVRSVVEGEPRDPEDDGTRSCGSLVVAGSP